MELSETAERSIAALAGQLQMLSHSLRCSVKEFRASPENERRHAIGVAVKALSEFIGNVFALDQDLHQPLDALLYALDDLDHGQVGPLLQRSEIDHRAKKPLSESLFRADAAALMDFYRQDGMPRKQAAMHTVSKLNELGYRVNGDRRIAAKEVERWRDELKSPRDASDPAACRYNFVLEQLKAKYPSGPEMAAKILSDILPDMFAPSIPKKPHS
jgi:hypothetical protein